MEIFNFIIYVVSVIALNIGLALTAAHCIENDEPFMATGILVLWFTLQISIALLIG